MVRVSVFIDGFNLYHGLRAKYDRRYLWLDLVRMADGLLLPGQTLVGVNYFTTETRSDSVSQQNQQVYLDALGAIAGLTVTLGRYQEKHVVCRDCGGSWRTYEEKETDVNIAVALVRGGMSNEFDTAVLLSADGDLCPCVRALRELAPAERVVAVFPPERRSDDLRDVADASFTLGDDVLQRALLPDIVRGVSGSDCRRPARWH